MKSFQDNEKLKTPIEFSNFSREILRQANRKLNNTEFLKELTNSFLNFCECSEIEIFLKEGQKYFYGRNIGKHEDGFSLKIINNKSNNRVKNTKLENRTLSINDLYKSVFTGKDYASIFSNMDNEVYWTNDAQSDIIDAGAEFLSLAILPIKFNCENFGMIVLKSEKRDFFKEQEVQWFQDLAETVGIAFNHQITQFQHRERVKELSCLYSIAKVAAIQGSTLDEILQQTVELLPPGWLYPDIASASIVLAEKVYRTPDFTQGIHKLTADLIVNKEKNGYVEVTYSEDKEELDEGPFLKEERRLLNTIARELSIIIERKFSAMEKERLREQLLHSDRLATIGQLAAGVAHELNEPLGNILGFAQLSKKSEDLPEIVASDLQKIEHASLHAREIIRKLLVFARQTPSEKAFIDLNKVVGECVDLLAGRLSKESIKLKISLMPDMPKISADHSQLNQVLINLMVNSMHAMPEGGLMTITTSVDDENAYLTVEDTGVGIEENILNQIFLPFFTTKGENQGTGLGLAVVHGIVIAHGGSIRVESRVMNGSIFEIQLPRKIEKENS